MVPRLAVSTACQYQLITFVREVTSSGDDQCDFLNRAKRITFRGHLDQPPAESRVLKLVRRLNANVGWESPLDPWGQFVGRQSVDFIVQLFSLVQFIGLVELPHFSSELVQMRNVESLNSFLAAVADSVIDSSGPELLQQLDVDRVLRS